MHARADDRPEILHIHDLLLQRAIQTQLHHYNEMKNEVWHGVMDGVGKLSTCFSAISSHFRPILGHGNMAAGLSKPYSS